VVSYEPQPLFSEWKEGTDGLSLHQEMDVYFVTQDPHWLEITENCIKLDVWSVYVTLSFSLVCHYKLTLK